MRQQATIADEDRKRFNELVNAITTGYLTSVPGDHILPQLEALLHLDQGKALGWARWVPERNAVEYTIGSHEATMAGMFHRLTGVLSSQGNQIMAAEIDRLTEKLVIDRFYVQDLDFPEHPPEARLAEISAKLLDGIENPSPAPLTFRKIWQSSSEQAASELNPMPTRVVIDNNTVRAFTIINVFAYDQIGLLYTITRALYDLKLEVHLAKITTHVDQVVDIFYVTDRQEQKIESTEQLQQIKRNLLAAIQENE